LRGETELAFKEERPGLLSRLWPSARRILFSWHEQVHDTLRCLHFAAVATRIMVVTGTVEFSAIHAIKGRGSGEQSNHFESYVCSSSLHFWKRLFS
jgi:hypothetical protein